MTKTDELIFDLIEQRDVALTRLRECMNLLERDVYPPGGRTEAAIKRAKRELAKYGTPNRKRHRLTC